MHVHGAEKNWVKIIFAFALAIATCANQALASSQIAIIVKNPDPYTGNQSWFVYEKNAGETIEDTAILKNYGNETAHIKIYAADASANNSGGFILKFSDEKQQGIGEWTKVGTPEIELKAGEKIDVPFKIEIPAVASPGQYVGGLVAEDLLTSDNSSTQQCADGQICNASISVKTRLGARIYLTIPGPVKEDVRWTGFSKIENLSSKTYFKFRIENYGNVAYEPLAHIEILDQSGNVIDKFDKTLGDSLPNSAIEPVVSWDGNPPLLGNITARATVTYPQRFNGNAGLHGSAETKTLSFIIIPWTLILILGIFIFFTGGFSVFKILNRKKILSACDQYDILENDNIVSISESRNIDWKKLAKINHLKAPFILKKGGKLYVPKINKTEEKQ